MRIGIITGKDDEISLNKDINKLDLKNIMKMEMSIQILH